MAKAKNKTLAAALAAFGGSMGLHRFYLHGLTDVVAWIFPIPSALGWWGVERMRLYGQDDVLSWLLIPLLGLSLTVGCLTAVVYALTPQEQWNTRHNPQLPADASAGRSHALTVAVLVFAMLAGTTAFMGSLAFSVQKYFEHDARTDTLQQPS
jgi:TM2 domain-containing membrane protein YozV